MLVYPVLDNSCSTPSATEFVDVPLWNANSNRNMWKMYLSAGPGGEAPPYAAPVHGQMRDLPPSYVETAEFDPLRDEGLRYVEKLRQAGIRVETNETKRTVHGYDANASSDIARQSMLARINFLNEAFTPRSA
jgi:acetyl esterase/lipase